MARDAAAGERRGSGAGRVRGEAKRAGKEGREGHARARLLALRLLHRDALLAVDGDAGHQVARHQRVLLAAGDEDAVVAMRLDRDLGAALSEPQGRNPAHAASTTGYQRNLA